MVQFSYGNFRKIGEVVELQLPSFITPNNIAKTKTTAVRKPYNSYKAVAMEKEIVSKKTI